MAVTEMSPRRRLLLGDIHGNWRALVQVLDRAGFDAIRDELYAVGDLVDGWPESKEVLLFLKQLPRFRWALGNHDAWFERWLTGVPAHGSWLSMGGVETIDSVMGPGVDHWNTGFGIVAPEELRDEYLAFMRSAEPYIEVDRRLIVHGGFDPARPIDEQKLEALMADRDLAESLRDDPEAADPNALPLTNYERVYLGHTGMAAEDGGPLRRREFWLIDQGAGWRGRLTLIDIDTDEWWQSDLATELYGAHPSLD